MKKMFVILAVLSEFLFTKLHNTSVKISYSLLCFTWKCVIELLIHKNMWKLFCKMKKKNVCKSCSLIRLFIYQDARYNREN